MKKNKLTKTLLALGLGMGLATSVSAVSFDLCRYWHAECLNGDSFACERVKYNCAP